MRRNEVFSNSERNNLLSGKRIQASIKCLTYSVQPSCTMTIISACTTKFLGKHFHWDYLWEALGFKKGWVSMAWICHHSLTIHCIIIVNDLGVETKKNAASGRCFCQDYFLQLRIFVSIVQILMSTCSVIKK